MARRKTQVDRPERIAAILDLIGTDERLADFYAAITEGWEGWIEYKFQQHGDQYALPRTELNAIKTLSNISRQSPHIAGKILEYCEAQLWHGIFMPHDRALIQQWQQEAAPKTEPEPPKIKRSPFEVYPHLLDLVDRGFPAKAWAPDPRNQRWFETESAEAVGDWTLYCAENAALFEATDVADYLLPQQWDAWMSTKQSLYMKTSLRLHWHDDWQKNRQQLKARFGTIGAYFQWRQKEEQVW